MPGVSTPAEGEAVGVALGVEGKDVAIDRLGRVKNNELRQKEQSAASRLPNSSQFPSFEFECGSASIKRTFDDL